VVRMMNPIHTLRNPSISTTDRERSLCQIRV
jgi:hypothetical protein